MIYLPNPEVFYKVFKDNQSFIDAAESNKFSPRTNHISIKYHHFRNFVQKKIIRICYIDTRKKLRKFSISHSTKHYSSIYEGNYLDGDLKSETFASTWGGIMIQITNRTHNYHSLFDLSCSSYFELTH